MTLLTSGKDYIAREFGIGNCYVSSGLSWTAVAVDGSTVNETGGTAGLVARLVTTAVYTRVDLTSPRVRSYTYNDLRNGNGGTGVTLSDAQWIASNDGLPAGENKYCAVGVTPAPSPAQATWSIGQAVDVNGVPLSSAKVYIDGVYTTHYTPEMFTVCSGCKCDTTIPCDFGTHTCKVMKTGYADWSVTRTINPGDQITEIPVLLAAVATPTPTPGITPTPTPGLTPTPAPIATPSPQVFEFVGVPAGLPTVSLDLSALVMRQAADYHFEMNSVVITNTSQWTVYLAMEVKLFKGALTSCPVTGYVFDGIDRTEARNVRIKTLQPGESATYNADFYQPPTIVGVHTVCLLVHGTWIRSDLEVEISSITG